MTIPQDPKCEVSSEVDRKRRKKTGPREIIQIWLRDQIEQGDTGTRLPTIRDIMQQFATSQRVVEDAIAPFVETGRVSKRRGAGMIICDPVQAPAVFEADILVLYRLSESRLANSLLLDIEKRMKSRGHSILILGFADDDHGLSVLQRLGRFRTCLVQVHFAQISLPLLAQIHKHSASVIVDGISTTGVGVDAIGTNWREALSEAWTYLNTKGHSKIAFLTSAHSARQIAMARREYLTRASLGPGSWLIEIDELPGSYSSDQIREALQAQQDPDGNFPFTALIAWGVVEGYRLELALRELGVVIGVDLSVVVLGSVDFGSEHLSVFDVVGNSNAEKTDRFETVILDRVHGSPPNTKPGICRYINATLQVSKISKREYNPRLRKGYTQIA